MLKNRWQLLLAGIFLAFLTFSYWSITLATSRVSPVADPDYYHSGQRYHLAERAWRAAAKAGWQALLARDGEELRLRLLDGAGVPVGGGVVLLKNGRMGNALAADWRVPFSEGEPGVYLARLVDFPVEPVELLLVARRGEALLERRLRVNGDSWPETRL
ncbi:FixH family protein [Desulfurivibrio sp. D14AmB]|uniref:FixH family protein n=1 Tax=Desulfurivibrio sp. D14AmB TaxID=3374370 RepID=UPI00376F1F20